MQFYIIESVEQPGQFYAGHNSDRPEDFKLTPKEDEAQAFDTEEEATLFSEQNIYPGGAAFWGTRPVRRPK